LVYSLVFHAYINEMHGSRSKIPNKKSRQYISIKFLALLGAPYIYDSRLRVNVLHLNKTVIICLCEKHMPYYIVCSHYTLHSNQGYAKNFMDCMGFWEHHYPIVWLLTLLLNADLIWEKRQVFVFWFCQASYLFKIIWLFCVLFCVAQLMWYFCAKLLAAFILRHILCRSIVNEHCSTEYISQARWDH
jgi:hypothetical protein